MKNQYPRQESNLDLKFRKLLFYPLNYEGCFPIYHTFILKTSILSIEPYRQEGMRAGKVKSVK